jgi:hypothetical protein
MSYRQTVCNPALNLGHTSLTGAVDAQLAVKRDNAGIITVKVEWLKDGQEGAEIVSRLEQVELGADSYGDPIVSCVVVADDPMARLMATPVDQIVRPGAAKLKLECTLWMDRCEAVQMATCRACSSSNLTGLLYPSAEWRRLAL